MNSPVKSLKRQVQVQTTTLISGEAVRDVLNAADSGDAFLADVNPIETKIQARSLAQQAHNQRCLYRMCAAITTFKVRDPDPNAVDEGKILGIRIEAMDGARFLRPYYVLLNRPYDGSKRLRVHRHTLPPAIPLPGLAARYLQKPKAADDSEDEREQDLPRFVRCLRREVVRYHGRVSVLADMRSAAGLDEAQSEAPDGRAILDIHAADAETKHITIDWADGRTGRLVLDQDGRTEKLVVFKEHARDRETVRELLAGGVGPVEVVKRLGEALET